MSIAFEDSLGLQITEKHADGVTIELPIPAAYMNSQGTLHGGIIASLADEAAWHAMLNHYGESKATTTELKINYLLPVTGAKITARAYMLRAGKTLCVTRIDMLDERGRLAAFGVVTYMMLDPR